MFKNNSLLEFYKITSVYELYIHLASTNLLRNSCFGGSLSGKESTKVLV